MTSSLPRHPRATPGDLLPTVSPNYNKVIYLAPFHGPFEPNLYSSYLFPGFTLVRACVVILWNRFRYLRPPCESLMGDIVGNPKVTSIPSAPEVSPT